MENHTAMKKPLFTNARCTRTQATRIIHNALVRYGSLSTTDRQTLIKTIPFSKFTEEQMILAADRAADDLVGC
jgi:hypothetical protein